MTVENKHTIYINRCIEIINKTVSIRFSSTCPSRLDKLSFLDHMVVLIVLTRVGVVTKTFFAFHLWKMQKLFIATSDLFFRLLKKVLNPCFRFKIDYILGLPCKLIYLVGSLLTIGLRDNT